MDKKIINQIQLNGQRVTSEKIWLKNIKFFDKSFSKDYKKMINQALVNVAPLLKVKQLKQKKKRLQIKEFPYIVQNENRVSLALKFFLNRTKKKKEIKMQKKLIPELLAASNNSGITTTKKRHLYEYAYLKKKYFYYRWF